MDYSLVKEALANAVKAANIPHLDSYSYLPDTPHLPCFFAGEVAIRVNNSYGGYDEATITCSVFVSASDDRDGQRTLDRLISRTGPYSIRQALNDHGKGAPGQPALDGTCDDFSIDSIEGYGKIQVGDNQTFYGANITVRLIGSNEV